MISVFPLCYAKSFTYSQDNDHFRSTQQSVYKNNLVPSTDCP